MAGSTVVQHDLTQVKNPEEFQRFGSQVISDLQDLVNGNLLFSNMKTNTVTVTFSSANSNKMISHNLGKNSVNYFVVNKSVACDVYNGTGSTKSIVSLKCNTAGAVVTLILF